MVLGFWVQGIHVGFRVSELEALADSPGACARSPKKKKQRSFLAEWLMLW